MHTTRHMSTTLAPFTTEQLGRLGALLADQEQFRTQQVAQLSSGLGGSTAQDEIRTLLLEGALDELARTRAARTRLLDGTYGRCLSCTSRLGLDQLDALPHAELCLACSRAGAR